MNKQGFLIIGILLLSIVCIIQQKELSKPRQNNINFNEYKYSQTIDSLKKAIDSVIWIEHNISELLQQQENAYKILIETDPETASKYYKALDKSINLPKNYFDEF